MESKGYQGGPEAAALTEGSVGLAVFRVKIGISWDCVKILHFYKPAGCPDVVIFLRFVCVRFGCNTFII